jgi:uncharacterized protein YdhG (YjbR/CyaY superfamily)
MIKSSEDRNQASIDEYIASFYGNTKTALKQLRSLINKIAPQAIESISYGMPTFKVNGKPLIYFAGYKNHVGLYALPNTHKVFNLQLAKYKQGKGSVQFPLDQPMPMQLITKMIQFRLKEVD